MFAVHFRTVSVYINVSYCLIRRNLEVIDRVVFLVEAAADKVSKKEERSVISIIISSIFIIRRLHFTRSDENN